MCNDVQLSKAGLDFLIVYFPQKGAGDPPAVTLLAVLARINNLAIHKAYGASLQLTMAWRAEMTSTFHTPGSECHLRVQDTRVPSYCWRYVDVACFHFSFGVQDCVQVKRNQHSINQKVPTSPRYTAAMHVRTALPRLPRRLKCRVP